MRSSFGKNIIVTVWGGSHETAVGVDIEGLPLGTEIDMDALRGFLSRRAPGRSPFATKRKEADLPAAVSGLAPGCSPSILVTSDRRISFEIPNTDVRSEDYKALASVPRPGHADFTARLRYGDELDMAGGGPFSARMTAPLCIAGGIALQLLAASGIRIGAHIFSVADAKDAAFDPVSIAEEGLSETPEKLFRRLSCMDFPVIDESAGELMKKKIIEARDAPDSVGGIVEAAVLGLPAGVGGAMYDGLESTLAPVLFGIPAVKGVEFGAGFGAAALRGSENNDAFYYPENHTDIRSVRTRTNNHGGILGGISTGMPLITRVAFKPTPSIARPQESVDLAAGKDTMLEIKGRHDPCVVVRAVPVVEAALAIGLLDSIMEERR